jgi:pimeloyl-ACP methyl ester carboxylesterase
VGRVIAYDRRGCTRSERPETYECTTVAEQADDAAALLDALVDAPAVVIGRSYGGAVAVDLALRYPDHVRALVLLEGDALGLSPAGLEWTRAIRDRLREVAASEGVDAVYETLIGEVLGDGAWTRFRMRFGGSSLGMVRRSSPNSTTSTSRGPTPPRSPRSRSRCCSWRHPSRRLRPIPDRERVRKGVSADPRGAPESVRTDSRIRNRNAVVRLAPAA